MFCVQYIYVYHKYVYIGSLACMYMSTLNEHAICMYMCIVSNTCIKHMSIYMHLFVVKYTHVAL